MPSAEQLERLRTECADDVPLKVAIVENTDVVLMETSFG